MELKKDQVITINEDRYQYIDGPAENAKVLVLTGEQQGQTITLDISGGISLNESREWINEGLASNEADSEQKNEENHAV